MCRNSRCPDSDLDGRILRRPGVVANRHFADPVAVAWPVDSFVRAQRRRHRGPRENPRDEQRTEKRKQPSAHEHPSPVSLVTWNSDRTRTRKALPLALIRKPADLGDFSARSNPHQRREAWPAFEEGIAAVTEAYDGPGTLGGVKNEDPVDPESAYHRREAAAPSSAPNEPDPVVTRCDLRRPAGDLEIVRRDQPAGEEDASRIGGQTPPGGSKRLIEVPG